MERISLEVSESVGHLRLNSPQTGNAIDLVFAKELREATTLLQSDPKVRAILLSATGKNFCVGGNVKYFQSLDRVSRGARGREITIDLNAALSALVAGDKAVVAAVGGAVAGAGLGLACAADITFAANNSRFTLAYTGVGLAPDGGASYFLPRLVGYKRALELTLSNRVLSADAALGYGLVSYVVPAEELLDQANAFVMKLAQGPITAIKESKRLLLDSWTASLDAQLENESLTFSKQMQSDDANEGFQAFVEKRKPVFDEERD